MVHGIGIDIVRTARMREAVERWGQRFLERVFTAEEIAYAYKKKDPFLPLSVRFAAKEAFIKALSGLVPVSLTDISVRNLSDGRPVLEVLGRTGEAAEQMGIGRIHLSLSHERDYGVACVVIEGGK
jgi:phosphopantetheine--protein transferase-like protein